MNSLQTLASVEKKHSGKFSGSTISSIPTPALTFGHIKQKTLYTGRKYRHSKETSEGSAR